MNNSLVQDDLNEIPTSVEVQNNLNEVSTLIGQSSFLPDSLETPAPLPAGILTQEKPARSYNPYSWNFLNQLLDVVDARTNGKAGWLQRFISYLFFGGLAALVNLGVFYIMYYHLIASVGPATLRNVLSYVVAAELSILANFIPNDRFTFKHLPGAQRPWLQRCARFHMTTIVGSFLTFLIELALSSFTHTQPILAEAIATLLVLIYNFSFHHLFTYRHVKQAEVVA